MYEELDEIFYDWDTEEIEAETREFVVLEPGVYPFEVKDVEKERDKNGHPRAAVNLRVNDRTTVYDRIVLSSKWGWKIARIHEAVGLKDPSVEKFRPQWNALIGKTGFVKLKVREYESNGEKRKINDIEYYYRANEQDKATKDFYEQEKKREEPKQSAQYSV